MNERPLRPVGQAEIDSYERDGAVCLRGLLDTATATRLREASLRFMQAGIGRNREVRPADGTPRMFQSVWMGDLDEDFRYLRERSALPEIAAALMRVTSVRFFYDQLFIKEAGTSAPTPWHNDLPFWPFAGSHLVSLWVALTPVRADSGVVRYVPGSHRWNKPFRAITPDRDAAFENPELEVCPDYEQQGNAPAPLLSWDLEPGDIVAHHPMAVHGAAGNSNRQRRIGVSIRYLGSDVRYDPRPYVMRLPAKPAVAAGDYPADDKVFPVVWSQAA